MSDGARHISIGAIRDAAAAAPVGGSKVVAVVSGGNIDLTRFAQILKFSNPQIIDS